MATIKPKEFVGESKTFHEKECLKKLKHFLPTQAPLKDFVHHNTLHAFQDLPFETAIRQASEIFGYSTTLSVKEYKALIAKGRIDHKVLRLVIEKRKRTSEVSEWLNKIDLHRDDTPVSAIRIGAIRDHWKRFYHLDLDIIVHTNLFRILNSYLDQGIAIWTFPVEPGGLIESLRLLDADTHFSLFKTARVKNLLANSNLEIGSLLDILVKNESLYERYLFDQQFAHPGWSGMVNFIEEHPESLYDTRKISLEDLIKLELLLEIDNLDRSLGTKWHAIGNDLEIPPLGLFENTAISEEFELKCMLQEAFEWSYYNEVIVGLQGKQETTIKARPTFQAFFCIDDREGSIRRYIEQEDPDCVTFGTPGHFALDTYYQPENSRFYTKVCPAPLSPKYLIKAYDGKSSIKKDVHFTKNTHKFFGGWLISQTLGFWSALKLFINIFRPSISPSTSYSFRHMDHNSKLTIEYRGEHTSDDLQIGYTLNEICDRVESVLKSTGLVDNFAPLIYMVAHGASSVNNTHYAGYDCGACSGRPGSVNARAFSEMANKPVIREMLFERGLKIPDSTRFVGALHDTTRDEIQFYDIAHMDSNQRKHHDKNVILFERALDLNARERARRFELIRSDLPAIKVHKQVKKRSVSLFEPRPELNHASNALCIVANRKLSKQLFLDRRAFFNSYDYKIDPDGKYLGNILNAATPVCGGINLEYYFSRVDSAKLGAGSKLPHNVMGLIGVANGFEGDLRTGLPYQMVEMHDPIRLMMVVQHYPEIVLDTIQANSSTFEWYSNVWVWLIVMHPDSNDPYVFRDGAFVKYMPQSKNLTKTKSMQKEMLTSSENLPVLKID